MYHLILFVLYVNYHVINLIVILYQILMHVHVNKIILIQILMVDIIVNKNQVIVLQLQKLIML